MTRYAKRIMTRWGGLGLVLTLLAAATGCSSGPYSPYLAETADESCPYPSDDCSDPEDDMFGGPEYHYLPPSYADPYSPYYGPYPYDWGWGYGWPPPYSGGGFPPRPHRFR